jgi:hypothetical protein
MPPRHLHNPPKCCPPPPLQSLRFRTLKTCKHRQLSGRSGRGVMGHHRKPTSTIGDGLVGWLGGGGCTFVSGAISRDLVAPGLQNRFSSAPSTCSTVVRSGHHAGAVGRDGWGGAGGSETADLGICNLHRRNKSFANFRSCYTRNYRISAAQTRHLLSHRGGKADGEEFELSSRV